MKIKTRKKSKSLYDDEPKKTKKRPREDDEEESSSSSSSNSDADDWLTTNRADQIKQMRRHEAQQKKNSDRPPELWIKDGEARSIRFLSNEPIGSLWRYTIKSGNSFQKVTAPRLGEKDLFKARAMKPQLLFLYPVIDRTGYRDKKGKKIANVPRYLVATSRVEKSINKIREKKGDLTRLDIEYSRQGESTDTTYSFFVEGKLSKIKSSEKKEAKILRKKARNYYAPPTIQEQRAIVGDISEDDDD